MKHKFCDPIHHNGNGTRESNPEFQTPLFQTPPDTSQAKLLFHWMTQLHNQHSQHQASAKVKASCNAPPLLFAGWLAVATPTQPVQENVDLLVCQLTNAASFG